MTQKYYYQVAGHTFVVEMPEEEHIVDEMAQYAPFSVAETADVVFSLHVVRPADFPDLPDVSIEMNQDDDGSQILAGRAGERPYFEFQLWGRCAARMVTDATYRDATVVLVDEPLFGINNALMVERGSSTSTTVASR